MWAIAFGVVGVAWAVAWTTVALAMIESEKNEKKG